MTLAEEGAYRRALDIFYLNGSLPADVNQLAKLIGKGCTIQIATIVKSMFQEDRQFVNRLTHDYLEKLPEGFENEMIVMYEADDNRKQMFVQYCESLKTDEFIRQATATTMTLTDDQYQKILQEFVVYKLASGGYKNYKDTNDIRRNLINFIPYSRTLKSLSENGRPYANPKSATSKLEKW